MGRLVQLWKLEESQGTVTYRYGPKREQSGLLAIDKITGIVSRRESVPGMTAHESWFFYGMLAHAKAEKLFKEGVYPDETFIAV